MAEEKNSLLREFESLSTEEKLYKIFESVQRSQPWETVNRIEQVVKLLLLVAGAVASVFLFLRYDSVIVKSDTDRRLESDRAKTITRLIAIVVHSERKISKVLHEYTGEFLFRITNTSERDFEISAAWFAYFMLPPINGDAKATGPKLMIVPPLTDVEIRPRCNSDKGSKDRNPTYANKGVDNGGWELFEAHTHIASKYGNDTALFAQECVGLDLNNPEHGDGTTGVLHPDETSEFRRPFVVRAKPGSWLGISVRTLLDIGDEKEASERGIRHFELLRVSPDGVKSDAQKLQLKHM